MRIVTIDEYLAFVSRNKEVEIEGHVIKLEPLRVDRLGPVSSESADVSTTVWSFPDRGSWATHRGDYRGNWPPQLVRALLLMYTKPGDTVLDPMVGSGTTCIEAVLLGRNCVGVDINYNAVMLTWHRIYWLRRRLEELARGGGIEAHLGAGEIEQMLKTKVELYHGDARRLSLIPDGSVDMVATHPPYWGIVQYSGVAGDLSSARTLGEYLAMMKEVSGEAYRVLKPGKYAAILIGDTRIRKHYVPISHYVLDVFLDTGFILKEEVIKLQHKMKTTREVWQKLGERDFLLIFHEKLYIFRKPNSVDELKMYKYSSYYWLKEEHAE